MISSKTIIDISHLSDKAKILSKKINFHINKVRKSHEDLAALNALYLDNDIYNNNKNVLNNNRYNNANSNNNSNEKLNNSKEGENYEEAIRKKNLRNNFELIANNYHKQLSKAFIKYDPVIYLNNVKMLIQVSPTLREDITKIKKDVDQDVDQITDQKKYEKIYKRFLDKSTRSKSLIKLEPNIYKSQDILKKSVTTKNQGNLRERISPSPIPIKKNNKLILPDLGHDKINTNNRDYKIKVGMLKKMIKKDSKKFMDIRDQQFDEVNRLHNISKEIDNYIEGGNISKKIDSFVHDYQMNKYLNQFQFDDDENNKKNINFKPKDYYFSQRKKIYNLFGDLYTNKLEARIREKEKKLGDKLRMNKDDYFLKINEDMKKSLNEFDNNILENQINIDKENEQ